MMFRNSEVNGGITMRNALAEHEAVGLRREGQRRACIIARAAATGCLPSLLGNAHRGVNPEAQHCRQIGSHAAALFDRVAICVGSYSGRTKNHRNICTSSGMLRKTST